MSGFLEGVAKQTTPGTIQITVPSAVIAKQQGEMVGTLEISRDGFVFSNVSKKVTWFKFLGLGLYLPFKALAQKCVEIGKACLGKGNQKPAAGHLLNLAKIAWLGVLGRNSLLEKVNAFAVAELDFNKPSTKTFGSAQDQRVDFLNATTRSQRMKGSLYMARCLQPLFHQNQLEHPSRVSIKQKLDDLQKKKAALENLQNNRNTTADAGSWRVQKWVANFKIGRNFYQTMTGETIVVNRLASINEKIAKLEKQKETIERCKKYATAAIRGQQCCPDAVTTYADVKCCGITLYRHQQICGLLHKIECCATSCFALNCLCCYVCIWPDAKQCCLV